MTDSPGRRPWRATSRSTCWACSARILRAMALPSMMRALTSVLSRRRNVEHPLRVTVCEQFLVRLRQGQRIQELDRGRGWLVGIVDRPHDALRTEFLDRVLERQWILHAARRDEEVALEILRHGELRLRRAADVLRAAVHERDAPEPEMHGLAHVTDAHLELRKSVEQTRGHQAHGMRADLDAVAPHRRVHAIVAQRALEPIGCAARMNVE